MRFGIVTVFCIGMLVPLGVHASNPDAAQVQLVHASKHDLSKPLSKLSNLQPAPAPAGVVVEHRVRYLPLPRQTYPTPTPPQPPDGGSGSLDIIRLPIIYGIGRKTNYVTRSSPPDANGSAGFSEYVQWVNSAYAIFDKTTGALKPHMDEGTGQLESEIIDGSRLWQDFGGKCEFSNDGDPVVLFDKLAQRWVMTQFAYSKPAGPPYSECIAVSSSSDPAGAYARYQFDFNNFNDYPKLGIWIDGYYATFNMFEDENGEFLGSKICAFERDKMLTGEQAGMQCVNLYNPQYSGVLPADFDGLTSSVPPKDAPEYFVGLGSNKLNIWKYHVDWQDSTKSIFDRAPIELPVAPFAFPCQESGAQTPCIVQPTTTGQTLDSLGDRLMYRLAYRNRGGEETLVVNHTVQNENYTGIRWYEISSLSTMPSIAQQGTYAPPDAFFRWMGSMAMDKKGNMLLAYSVSGKSVYPSLRFTGRAHGDPLGTMRKEEALIAGQGSQVSSSAKYVTDRWGDYSSITLDPRDDCTFWFTGQYQTSNDTYKWNTAIFPLRFRDCQ